MRRSVLICMVILLLLMMVPACGEVYQRRYDGAETPSVGMATPTPTPAATPTPVPAKELVCDIVGDWAGTGIKTTEPIHVEVAPWLVGWNYEATRDIDGGFSIWLHEVGQSRPVDLLANELGRAGDDVIYVYETGTFYLEIEGLFVIWGVAVSTCEYK